MTHRHEDEPSGTRSMPPSMITSDITPDHTASTFWARLKALAAPVRTPPGHAKLTGKHLIAAVVALNFVNGIAFVDILGIGVIQSAISDRYDGKDAVDWNTTSALIGATVGQCIMGYMSDVFTRRRMLLCALALLFFGALGCALSSWLDYPELVVICRAICGAATGSISNLVNISQNDICSEQQRLNLQGVQGTSVATGSIIGSLAAALLPHWRYLYFLESALSTLGLVAIYKFVPPNKPMPTRSEIRSELRQIDFLGIATGIGWLVPGLILLSKWRSFNTAALIALPLLTASSAILFILLGLRTELPPNPPGHYSRLSHRHSRPIAPFRLFRNRTVAAIYTQNILFGAAYYSFIYFSPVLAQVVREESALTGVVKLIPYFVTHAIWSTVSARGIKLLQKKGRVSYSIVMASGFCSWTLAMGLLGWNCTRANSGSNFYGFAVLVGLGTGSVFQNSVLAITKQVSERDKAVALGTRNVLRFLGGAVGTAMSSTILRTVVRRLLPADLGHVADSAVADQSYFEDLTVGDEGLVRRANAKGIEVVWYTFTGVLGVCVLLCLLVKDEVVRKEGDEEKLTTTTTDGDGEEVVTPSPNYASRQGSGSVETETSSVRSGQSHDPWRL